MSHAARGRLGGLETIKRHGTEAAAKGGRKGAATLDARIAADAGIPPDAPDYDIRLKAARSLYYIRLRSRRP